MNPVFEAQSNHRYDTGDYHRTDDMLGGEEGLKKAHQRGKGAGIWHYAGRAYSPTRGTKACISTARGITRGWGAYQGEGSAYYDWYELQPFPR